MWTKVDTLGQKSRENLGKTGLDRGLLSLGQGPLRRKVKSAKKATRSRHSPREGKLATQPEPAPVNIFPAIVGQDLERLTNRGADILVCHALADRNVRPTEYCQPLLDCQQLAGGQILVGAHVLAVD